MKEEEENKKIREADAKTLGRRKGSGKALRNWRATIPLSHG
jgi:hypothetical protein